LSAWAVAHIAPTAPAKLNAMIRFIPKILRFAEIQQIQWRRNNRWKFDQLPEFSLSSGRHVVWRRLSVSHLSNDGVQSL
jgi:hypothetical protein